MSGDLIENMRGRVAQCRRLARAVLDEKAARSLLNMADEIEADVDRLLAEENGQGDAPDEPRPEPSPGPEPV